LETNTNVDI